MRGSRTTRCSCQSFQTTPYSVCWLKRSAFRAQQLIPVELDLDDSWSDDELSPSASVTAAAQPGAPDAPASDSRLAALQAEVERLQADLKAAQSMLRLSIEDESDIDSGAGSAAGPSHSLRQRPSGSRASGSQSKGKAVVRDDDTHYFDSYADNEIHEVMLKDTNRTVSYARFILSNPHIFRDAIVMDVGCGTGILSMFAARAGAKHVYAIEASGIADKAIANIRTNGLSDKITVIRGKVEEISLPEGVDKVDVIISEWMGYMLLYESMLDSVLYARDRFLRSGGIMAPSAAKLFITAITGEQTVKERVAFWDNIYGFNMAPMSSPSFTEGLVEIVDASEVVGTSHSILHMDAYAATSKSLDFTSSFSISPSQSGSTAQVRAFLTYFDTFFAPVSGTASEPEAEVDLKRWPDEAIDKPISPADATDGTLVSFTTGPQGKPTHWKQVVFLLREAITLGSGDTISGRFYCKKSTTNSRELDVEIHYEVATDGNAASAGMTVQMYKVR